MSSTTRLQLLDAVVERRTARAVYDADNSTSTEQEIADALRYNDPFEKMTTRELLAEWDALDPEEACART